MADMINHPGHYASKGNNEIECIDAIRAATANLQGEEAFCIGNAIKYLWRYREKNGMEDLEKSKWYINRVIEILSDEEAEFEELEVLAKEIAPCEEDS